MTKSIFPYRIALAGGWIDQPWISGIHPGSMVVASLEPTQEFMNRAGMATSSRKVGLELWSGHLPEGDPLRMAKLLFGAENPPGSDYVAGSQDHIGLLVPGISRLHYSGGYWPDQVDTTGDPDICSWLEKVIQLIPLWPRPEGYDPLSEKNLTRTWVERLGKAGDLCWDSILARDISGLGHSLTVSLSCWRNLLPGTVHPDALARLETIKDEAGSTFSGCGGGYIIAAADRDLPCGQPVKIRR